METGERFVRVLGRAMPKAVRTLSSELEMPRETAAETTAAAAGLALAGLAHHQRRRPRNARAAIDVVRKFGRPADVDAPELGIRAQLAREDLSPRLGGLLGDAGPSAAAWIASRTGSSEQAVSRALAAVMPLVLGALGRTLSARDLADWLSHMPEDALDEPDRLLLPDGAPAETYLALRHRGHRWWQRLLGTATHARGH
jgi:hypothetical protein